MSDTVKLVPCPCPSCQGKKVTPYIRRQHSRYYIRPRSATTQSPLTQSLHHPVGPLETCLPESESKLTNLPDHATEYESRLELPAPSVSVLEICDPLTSESELSRDPCSFKSLQLSTSQPEIYEWCQYMAMAGYISATSGSSEESEHHADQEQLSLSEEELHLLDELYLEIVPLYKHMSDEYEKALKRAINCRRKSQFPSKECWKPPFQGERELLLGPHPEIVMYKKKVIIHEKTKRKIVYSSAEHEHAQSRHKCSYVQIHSASESFAGATYELAIVDKFRQPQKDTDTGQWWVSPTTFDTVILQLSDLFPPQVVALEDEQLWFLNVN